MASTNPLISQHTSIDPRLNLQLHPLVILTISDYITRHTLREQTSPIVGAIIGQQLGRDITLEHAFECRTVEDTAGEVVLDTEWFQDRLQQYKDVHKSPALDFVGWFTLTPPSGPEAYLLPIHQQFLSSYNESAVLVAFHPSLLLDSSASNGKLPLTIYETVYETDHDDGDKAMQNAGAPAPALHLRFRELSYTVDTGEAEMIAVDSIAKGAGSAALSNTAATSSTQKGQTAPGVPSETESLSPEDEEIIASLTAKSNAIKMLHQRLQLMRAYLTSLPPSYYTDASIPVSSSTFASSTTITSTSGGAEVQADPVILRSIQSLIARLPLLIPSTETDSNTGVSVPSFEAETASLHADAALTTLLGTLGTTLNKANGMARKYQTVYGSRESGRRMGSMVNMAMGTGTGSGGERSALGELTPSGANGAGGIGGGLEEMIRMQ